MKNRSPSRQPLRVPKGRWARVWLSPEFVAWCERSSVVPKEIAPAVLHRWALENPGRTDLTIISADPDAAERIFAKRKGAR